MFTLLLKVIHSRSLTDLCIRTSMWTNKFAVKFLLEIIFHLLFPTLLYRMCVHISEQGEFLLIEFIYWVVLI